VSGWLDGVGPEARYLILVVGLFVLPRVLQRWRVPSAVSCLALGAALGAVGLFHGDDNVPVLSTIGIVSLFLFAGLEVDLGELRREAPRLAGHLGVFAVLVALTAWGANATLLLPPQASVLFALALLTPSTGFILDSLVGWDLGDEPRKWVKTNAVAVEVLALLGLLVASQAGDASALAVTTGSLLAMVVLVPIVLRGFVTLVLPHAPGTELSLLLVVALVCASITRWLGVYYLVGAFVVGVVAVRLRKRAPALASEKVQSAMELFATFFVPFYFFKAGLHLPEGLASVRALALGVALVVIVLPARVLVVALVRRVVADEPLAVGWRAGLALAPTFVFTLVLAEILEQRFELSAELHGALVVFTVVNTMIPGIVLARSGASRARAADPRPHGGS
jgi:Kef-type K+ transport system membrane component KefB